jgi:hypothetical protein
MPRGQFRLLGTARREWKNQLQPFFPRLPGIIPVFVFGGFLGPPSVGLFSQGTRQNMGNRGEKVTILFFTTYSLITPCG